jgi:predicted nucleic acid-binding protein
MTVVVNATPLIALARVEKLTLLRDLFGQVITTPEVFREVAIADRTGATEVRAARWIRQRRVTELDRYRRGGLSAADASLIALAKTEVSGVLITDDRRLIERARKEGLAIARTGAVLIQAKEAGLITSVKEILDGMIAAGFRVTRPAYRSVLRTAKEPVQ